MTAALKPVVIARKPGFRDGIPFKFGGQQMKPMTARQHELYVNGEFEPEPLTEAVERELEVPPLNFAQLKELRAQLERMNATPDMASFEALVEILAAALSRNYRGVPRWLIEQSIDVGNMAEITQAVMDVSGLKRKEHLAAKKAMAAAS